MRKSAYPVSMDVAVPLKLIFTFVIEQLMLCSETDWNWNPESFQVKTEEMSLKRMSEILDENDWLALPFPHKSSYASNYPSLSKNPSHNICNRRYPRHII